MMMKKKNGKCTSKCVIRGILMFEDYGTCLRASQTENNIWKKYLEKYLFRKIKL